MLNAFSRTELLFGHEALERLNACRVAVFGLGGVGGHAAEALARSGIGTLDVIDDDRICLTNLNRQLLATHSTIGRFKVDVAKERLRDIRPDIKVNKHKCFFTPETSPLFDFSLYDYVVDAIDTVAGKLEIIMRANAAGVRVISSMGAGNKLDPTAFRVADIYDTRVCPLARVMRSELRRRGIKSLKVVYSEEPPLVPIPDVADDCRGEGERSGGHSANDAPALNRGGPPRRSTPGSNAFVPSVAGLIIAGEVIRDLAALPRT